MSGVVPREKAHLLGRAAALVLGVGVAEDSAAALLGELLHRGPRALRTHVVVYAVGVALPQSILGDALDLVPVDLRSRGQHQKIVIDPAVRGRFERVGVGMDYLHVILHPLHALGHAVGLRFPHVVGAVNAARDEGEAGLVELTVAGVDQRDVGILQRTLQPRSHADARRAAAYDDDAALGGALGGVCLVGA